MITTSQRTTWTASESRRGPASSRRDLHERAGDITRASRDAIRPGLRWPGRRAESDLLCAASPCKYLRQMPYSCVMTRRLADVAKKVGVSEATVSRVLNGKLGVSPSTRDAVLTALDVLGYERPTKLRGERGRLVGLVLPELQNPIFPALAEVVGVGLTQQGFTPVLCVRAAGGLSEADYVRMLLGQQVSGMVFAGGNFAEADSTHDHYRRLVERGVPAVLVNAAVDHIGFPRVSVDDAAAVEQAFGHLASLGHQAVGMGIGPEDHLPSRGSWPPSWPSPRERESIPPGWWSAPCSRWRLGTPPRPGWCARGSPASSAAAISSRSARSGRCAASGSPCQAMCRSSATTIRRS